MGDRTRADIAEWDGVIGPQSNDEPLFYELQVENETVRLIGPAPGQLREYAVEEFRALVNEGEWMLAAEDPDDGTVRTPDGEEWR